MIVRSFALTLILGSALASGLAAQEPPAPAKKLGILVYPGVQVIDFTGPYEVLTGAFAARRPLFDVVTVGLTHDEFRMGQPGKGIRMLADYSLEDCPKLDILLVPGGETDSVEDDARAMAWVGKTAADAECVMSVCNGAFVLAKAGLLKNQKATTFYWFLDELKQAEPTCTLVYDERFADNGKIITTAGLSSGIDGALHLIERYGSRYDAEQRALGLEYHWQPDLNWSRAGLADRHLVTMLGNAGFEFPDEKVSAWTVVANNGTKEQWTKSWTFDTPLAKDEVTKIFESKLAASWGKVAGSEKEWAFADEKGGAWKATLMLTDLHEGHWSASIDLHRA
jgi:putative intracellular protease/amidase